MTSKDRTLKKKLIMEGIIYAVALVVMAGGGMLLSNYDDDTQSEKQNRTNENAQMNTERESIEEQLGTGLESNIFYDTYTKNHNADLQLKRDSATQWMSALHESNHLTGLNVSILPITDISLPLAPLKSGTLVKSDIHLTCAGVTDNSIYGFLRDLERKMPGMIAVQDIKLSRTADLSRDVVMNLGQHHIVPLVTGDISFSWLGIRPSDSSKPDASPPSSGSRNGAR